MELKPIKTEEGYGAAMKEIDRLWNAAKPGTSEGDYFQVLVMLVETYEKEHYPIELPDPIEAIKHYVESRGLTNADLVPYLGSPSRVSEILNRKRPLTLSMIRNLEELGIPASILVQKYTLDISSRAKSGQSNRKRPNLVAAVTGNRKRKTDDDIALPPKRKRDYPRELAA